jgi:hypothetical protein
MKQGRIKLGLVTATLLMGSTALMAGGDIIPAEEPAKEDAVKENVVKRTLNGNMTLNYHVLPGEVDNIHDLFSEGIFYGRLRSNTFYWSWANTPPFSNEADKNMGLGGSLVYKSAVLSGFSFTMGYYGSMNPSFWRPGKDSAKFSKAGKDTFSRYKL